MTDTGETSLRTLRYRTRTNGGLFLVVLALMAATGGLVVLLSGDTGDPWAWLALVSPVAVVPFALRLARREAVELVIDDKGVHHSMMPGTSRSMSWDQVGAMWLKRRRDWRTRWPLELRLWMATEDYVPENFDLFADGPELPRGTWSFAIRDFMPERDAAEFLAELERRRDHAIAKIRHEPPAVPAQ